MSPSLSEAVPMFLYFAWPVVPLIPPGLRRGENEMCFFVFFLCFREIHEFSDGHQVGASSVFGRSTTAQEEMHRK